MRNEINIEFAVQLCLVWICNIFSRRAVRNTRRNRAEEGELREKFLQSRK